MDWNGAIELKIGSAQGLNLKKQGASARETSEFRKFHKKDGPQTFSTISPQCPA